MPDYLLYCENTYKKQGNMEIYKMVQMHLPTACCESKQNCCRDIVMATENQLFSLAVCLLEECQRL